MKRDEIIPGQPNLYIQILSFMVEVFEDEGVENRGGD